MTRRQKRALVLALATIAIGLALAADAEAQVVAYYYTDPVWYSNPVHYHRVYQGTSWHWTPCRGWHGHDHYVDLPCWRSGYYLPWQQPYLPVVTYYSR